MKFTEVLKKYKFEIILFLISFGVQLIPFFIWFYFHPDLLLEDKEAYWMTAQNIIKHGSFSTISYLDPDAVRPPVYPLFLAISYLSLFKNLTLVLFFQNIISALTTVLVYRLGRSIFNKKTGILAAVLYLFEAEHLMMSSLTRSEILFTLFLLLSITYFVKYFKDFHRKDLLFSSLFLGVATLTRPNSQLFFAVYIFIMLLTALTKKIGVKKLALDSVLLLSVFLFTLLPWSLRNYIQLGTVKISPVFEYNVYSNLIVEAKNIFLKKHGGTNQDIKNRVLEDEKIIAAELKLPRNEYAKLEAQGYFRNRILTEFKKDPRLYIGSYFSCKLTYLINDASAYFISAVNQGYDTPIWNIPDFIAFPLVYYGMKFAWMIIWLIIAIGLVLELVNFFYHKKEIPWLMDTFLVLSIVYFGMLTFCAGPLTRYRFPTNPLIFILFAHFLYLLIDSVKKARISREETTQKT